jgi:hypothetical protein
MATQIKVPLDRACHDRIDDGARRKVKVAGWLATFDDGGPGEKDKFVVFANDGERDGRVEVRLHGYLRGVGVRGRGVRRECVHTSDAGVPLTERRFELALRDAICT